MEFPRYYGHLHLMARMPPYRGVHNSLGGSVHRQPSGRAIEYVGCVWICCGLSHSSANPSRLWFPCEDIPCAEPEEGHPASDRVAAHTQQLGCLLDVPLGLIQR